MADFMVAAELGALGTVLREGAELTSAKVGDVPGGTRVRVVEEVVVGGTKVRVRLEDPAGWVTKKTLVPVADGDGDGGGDDETPAPMLTVEMCEDWCNGARYAEHACDVGVPPRPHGLIADDDPHWVALQARGRVFQKHGADTRIQGFVCATDCFIVGDEACDRAASASGPLETERDARAARVGRDRGIDLRYALPNVVLEATAPGLVGVVRFAKKCRIMGSAMPSPVHGGAIHAVLDELMAEHMKATVQPTELARHRRSRPPPTSDAAALRRRPSSTRSSSTPSCPTSPTGSRACARARAATRTSRRPSPRR